VLDNLLAFPTIDHQAERILVYIAEKHPTLVWDFFHRRLEIEPTDEGNYEAIPYQLHDLNKPLARDAVVAATGVRQWYVAGDHMFQYTGARLLHAVFPAFTAELERWPALSGQVSAFDKWNLCRLGSWAAVFGAASWEGVARPE
jgi:hypothetical protein